MADDGKQVKSGMYSLDDANPDLRRFKILETILPTHTSLFLKPISTCLPT